MRLICPNCGAQYEVADDVIPEDGRDVQCSNCGHTWFEHYGASDIEDEFFDTPVAAPAPSAPDTAAFADPDPAPQPAASKRQELDPAITDILREEAAREADARRRETASSVESQPDLGLDRAQAAPDQRTQETQRRLALLKGEETAAIAAATAASRRELLPDIEEINSSLRSEAERSAVDTPHIQTKARRGFRTGFLGAILILALLAATYVLAPQITETIPALAPTLDSYVVAVDDLRLWVDLKMQGMVAAMGAAS